MTKFHTADLVLIYRWEDEPQPTQQEMGACHRAVRRFRTRRWRVAVVVAFAAGWLGRGWWG